MSAASGSVLPRGIVGKAEALSTFHEGRHRKTRVIGGQVDVAEVGVGLVDSGDPRQLELLDQPVLKRPERPLRPASGLRREGPDVLDAQLLERPADLGQMLTIDLAGLGRMEIMPAAVFCRGSSAGRASQTLP